MENFAIIIPHRGRKEDLNFCLNKLETYLTETKQTNYFIIVPHQVDMDTFYNLSLGFNAGIKFTLDHLKEKNITHFIFQGVDAIPVNDINYQKPENIVHLMGIGICKFLKNDIININGYDENHFGWGYEDCSLYDRIDTLNIKYTDQHPDGGNYDKNRWVQIPNKLDTKDLYPLWYNENTTKRNSKVITFFRSLSKEDRLKYMEVYGYSNINLNKIKIKYRTDKIFHIEYHSGNYV
jgi:hypothetical protein